MATCTVCKRTYYDEDCPYCTATATPLSEMVSSDKSAAQGNGEPAPTAFLVDLVSNRKIPITTPRCKVGRDDLNDIVISGDQSISRFHFVISMENNQYFVQDSKSRHGTFLNGNQISGPLAINDGDVLKVGVSLFWFVIENQAFGTAETFAPVDIESIDSNKPVSVAPKSAKGATSEVDMETTMPALQEALKKAADELEDKPEKADSKESKSDEAAKSKAGKKDEAEPAEPKSESKVSDGSEKSNKESDSAAMPAPTKKGKAPGSPQITASMLLEALEAETKTREGDSAESESPKAEKEESKEESEEKKDREDAEPAETKDVKEEAAEEVSKSKSDETSEEVSKSKSDETSEEVSKSKSDETSEEVSKSKSDETSEEVSKSKSDETSRDDEKREDERSDVEPSESPKSEDEPAETPDNGKSDTDFSPEVKGLTDEGLDDILPAVRSGDLMSKGSSSEDRISEEYDWTESPPESNKKESAEPESSSSQSTLEKLADVVEGAASKDTDSSEPGKGTESADTTSESAEKKESRADSLLRENKAELTSNGATGGITMSQESTTMNVPQWCTKFFATELNQLNRELDNLNEQVREAQQKIKEVENRVVATKGLRNTLLTATGEDLVEACGKVLARLGWKVKIVEDDKQELRLEHEGKVAICRIIWTDGLPERSHLGQLSIAQTRYYIDQGAEPKGILIAAQAHEKAPPKLSKDDYNGDLADYASKKNLCLMTTLQLLALYKEVALNDGNSETLRTAVYSTNGWLAGYSLEPSDEDEKEPKAVLSA